MHRRSWSIVPLGLMLLASACSKGVKQDVVDPYLVDKAQVHRDVDVIAVAPVTIPDGLPEREKIESWFAQEVEDKLHEGRFSVLFPYEYVSFWEDAVEQVGGLSDETGARDHAKVAAAMKVVLERLGFVQHVDAMLVPSVKIVEAPFAGGSAYWDDAKQSIKSGNPVREFLAGSPDGKVGALSLIVTLYNMAENVLYERAGGIEVLSRMEAKQFIMVPRNELFTDEARMVKAVDIALDPLVD